jgi:hypothetical protein
VGFSQPSAGGDQFDAKDYNGRLLIVYPKSFAAETPTAHGISPSADCDIVVVDAIDPATGMPKYFQNARLFGNLAKSVSRDLGGQVLGRLGQVPTQRGNPAWVLQNYTDQDAALAGPADAAYQAGQFKQAENPMSQPQQPQQPQQAPPQQQWNAAPAPTPAPQRAPAAPPAQQWQGAPPAAPAPPQQQQWPQQQAPAQQAPPAQQQWQQQPPAAAPPQQYQAPAPAAPPAAADPGLVARINSFGIPTNPGITQAEAEAINATLPQ